MQHDRIPGFALSQLQARLDTLQAQHLILAKRTGIALSDRKRQQAAIYSDFSAYGLLGICTSMAGQITDLDFSSTNPGQ